MDNYIQNIKGLEKTKGRQVRALKIAENIKNLLNSKLLLLVKNYKPSRIFSFTSVVVSKGFSSVDVFFTPVGFKTLEVNVKNIHPQDQEVVNYLKTHKNFFKQYIASDLNLKYVPEIKFYPDLQMIIGFRLDRVLDKNRFEKNTDD